MSRLSDAAIVAIALVILAVVVLAGNLVAQAPVVQKVPSTPAAYDREPTCAEWSDGCIVCRRTDEGPVCSMPGIACVRGEPQCLTREGT